MQLLKRRKRFSGFLFVSISATLYIRQNAYIVADCKRHRKQDKIGNDFSGFSKCSDLISEHVKRTRFDFWITAALSLSLCIRAFPIPTKASKQSFESLSNFFFWLCFSVGLVSKSINGIQASLFVFRGLWKKAWLQIWFDLILDHIVLWHRYSFEVSFGPDFIRWQSDTTK